MVEYSLAITTTCPDVEMFDSKQFKEIIGSRSELTDPGEITLRKNGKGMHVEVCNTRSEENFYSSLNDLCIQASSKRLKFLFNSKYKFNLKIGLFAGPEDFCSAVEINDEVMLCLATYKLSLIINSYVSQ